MERHHQLRRDPDWSPHGCNLCGKEGHQAATCCNGSMNWIDRFGLDAFIPRKPYYDIKPREEPDYADIEARAKKYAQAKLAADSVDTAEAGKKFAQELSEKEKAEAEEKARAAKQQADLEELNAGLPQGWRGYRAPNGKPYYHNAATGVTQWKPPAPE